MLERNTKLPSAISVVAFGVGGGGGGGGVSPPPPLPPPHE